MNKPLQADSKSKRSKTTDFNLRKQNVHVVVLKIIMALLLLGFSIVLILVQHLEEFIELWRQDDFRTTVVGASFGG